MRLAKLFLRKHPSEYIPEDWEQQQFNQVIAVVCLALGLIGYLVHWRLMAYVFTAMVALAAFIAILGFCVGCFIRYHWNQYTYRRISKNS
jgi:ABC-type transporter Mla maintaining outer membrane lipid asymmetry permease subunit MlaE